MNVAPEVSSVTLTRTMDAEFLNSVANHPEVRAWLMGEGVIDLTIALRNPANIALEFEGGGFLLTRQEAGIYEVHSMVLPEFRGLDAASAMRDGLRYMFTSTDCCDLYTRVSKGNPAAVAAAVKMGFRRWFERSAVKLNNVDDLHDMSYFHMSIDDWLMHDEKCGLVGEDFNQMYVDAMIEAGIVDASPDPDPAFMQAVGFLISACLNGCAAKGTVIYNRWAVFAGYPPVAVVSVVPVVVDFGKIVVEFRSGNLEVLCLRS